MCPMGDKQQKKTNNWWAARDLTYEALEIWGNIYIKQHTKTKQWELHLFKCLTVIQLKRPNPLQLNAVSFQRQTFCSRWIIASLKPTWAEQRSNTHSSEFKLYSLKQQRFGRPYALFSSFDFWLHLLFCW